MTPFSFNIRAAFLPLVIGVFVFTVYVLTLCPSIFMGDSGELSAAAFSMGGAHPPGYILYSIIGKAFTLLPFGNIAYRINLMSAFFSAGAAVFLYLSIFFLTRSASASVSGSLFLSLSSLVWQSSVIAEVYAMNLFFCAVLFYIGLRALEGDADLRLPLLAAFITGLAMGNHQSAALMAPALLFAFLLKRKDYVSFRVISLCLLAFVAGFSVNSALLLRGSADVLFDYSYATNIKKLIAALLRKDYEGDTVSAITDTALPGLQWLNGLNNSIIVILREYGYLNILLVVGAVYLYKKSWKMPVFFALIFLFIGAFLFGGSRYNPIDRFTAEQFLLPLFLPAAALMGVGVYAIKEAAMSFSKGRGFTLINPAVSATFALLPLLALFPKNISVSDVSDNFFGYQSPKDAMTIVPTGSLLINYTDDYVFGGWYLQLVERYREDIVLAGSRLESNRWQFPAGSLKDRFRDGYPLIYSKDYKRRDEFVAQSFGKELRLFASHKEGLSKDFNSLFEAVPYGHIYLLVPKDTPFDREAMIAYVTGPLEKLNYEGLLDIPFAYRGINSLIQCMRYSTVFWEYAYGFQARGMTKEADRFYKVAIEFYPKKELLEAYESFKAEAGNQGEKQN